MDPLLEEYARIYRKGKWFQKFEISIFSWNSAETLKNWLSSLYKAAYCDNEEIANGAMDSFQELLESNPTNDEEILVQGKFIFERNWSWKFISNKLIV